MALNIMYFSKSKIVKRRRVFQSQVLCPRTTSHLPKLYVRIVFAYNCKDGNFKISLPAGWQVQSSGKGRYASARFTSGKALISVKTSLAGSLFGSMAETGVLKVTHPNQPVRRSPVTSVHLMEKESFQENEGVEEEDPMKIQTGLGEGQKSEFHGSNAFGAETHGYRVTTLSRDYRIRVVCKCPASEWESLQPAFDKVIESVGFGRAE